jgi:cytochrome d ubiquinol oxidase subunit II
LLVAIGCVSLATPFLEGKYHERWFDTPGLFVTIPMPILVLGATWGAWRAIARGHDAAPFFWVLSLFGLSLVGLGISIWPDVVPGRISIWEAAAPYDSQLFMLVGSAVLIPLILAYTAWAYFVFRGKVGEDGYHEH